MTAFRCRVSKQGDMLWTGLVEDYDDAIAPGVGRKGTGP